MSQIKQNRFFNKQTYLITGAALGVFLIASAYIIWQWLFALTVNTASKKVVLFIRTNQTIEQLYNDLQHKQLLGRPRGFKQVSSWFKLSTKIKPGRYEFDAPMSNLMLVNMLLKGRQKPFNIVFNYADNKEQIAAFFGKQLELDSLELLKLLNNATVTQSMGFDTLNIINVFVPNTYNFYWNTNALSLLNRMYDEYKQFWNAERRYKAQQLNLSLNDVCVLASIVQKETNKLDEMSLVAGVYLNRLKKGIPLQADPTILYFLNNKDIKRVLKVHTQTQSVYNTYLNAGLPPGPICVASPQAIDAVLNATAHKFLYFCAREDFSGYHNFAQTLSEHQKNARKYQRALNKLNILK